MLVLDVLGTTVRNITEVTTRQLTNTRPSRSLKIGPLPELHYISGARPQPPEVDGDSQPDSESPTSYITGKRHDLLWTLLRSRQDVCRLGRPLEALQTVPSWSGFNSLVHASNAPQPTRIGYLPIIPEPPTNLSTIYELIHRSVKITRHRGQQYCIITAD